MTAPKHTPGPWFVRNQADIMTANGAARRDGERAAENDAWTIAHYENHALTQVAGGNWQEGLPREEADANLTLMAESPVVLHALERLLQAQRAGTTEPEWEAAIKTALWALGRVYGESWSWSGERPVGARGEL